MSVNSVGSTGSVDIARMAASFFKKADVNGDGGIDKDELKAMMTNGPGGGKSAADVDKMFAEADVNGDGTIDQTENENQLRKIGAEMQARSAQGGGKPPPGGPPPAAGSSGGSADSGKVYDARDTNKDGTVSAQEAYSYSLTHPDASKGSKDTVKSAFDDLLDQMNTGTKYNSKGTLSATTNGTESLFSLVA